MVLFPFHLILARLGVIKMRPLPIRHNAPIDPMEELIRRASEEVMMKGYEQASEKAIILAGFAWLAAKIDRSMVANGNGKRNGAKDMAVGGGVVGALATAVIAFLKAMGWM